MSVGTPAERRAYSCLGKKQPLDGEGRRKFPWLGLLPQSSQPFQMKPDLEKNDIKLNNYYNYYLKVT